MFCLFGPRVAFFLANQTDNTLHFKALSRIACLISETRRWLSEGKAGLSNPVIKFNLVTSKSVCGIFDQVRLKPACAATEAS